MRSIVADTRHLNGDDLEEFDSEHQGISSRFFPTECFNLVVENARDFSLTYEGGMYYHELL